MVKLIKKIPKKPSHKILFYLSVTSLLCMTWLLLSVLSWCMVCSYVCCLKMHAVDLLHLLKRKWKLHICLRELVHLVVFPRKCPDIPALELLTDPTTITNDVSQLDGTRYIWMVSFSLCCIVWFCLIYWVWKACWSLADLISVCFDLFGSFWFHLC